MYILNRIVRQGCCRRTQPYVLATNLPKLFIDPVKCGVQLVKSVICRSYMHFFLCKVLCFGCLVVRQGSCMFMWQEHDNCEGHCDTMHKHDLMCILHTILSTQRGHPENPCVEVLVIGPFKHRSVVPDD